MKISRQLRLGLRVQTVVFVVLLLAVFGALAYLSTHYLWQSDWTRRSRLSLGDASRKALKTLDGPVSITAFARDNPTLRKRISRFIQQYQRVDDNIDLSFVNPDTRPRRMRELGITANGELYVRYKGRDTKVKELTEAALTNALLRISHASASRIVFLSGHGERDPNGGANFDLGDFGKALEKKGFQIATLNLAERHDIPADAAVLVVAGAQVDYLPGEVAIINHFVGQGGNLLWLGDPGSLHGLKPLAKKLDIRFLNGTIVDATSRTFGVQDVRWLVLNDYPASPITQHFKLNTLIPGTTGIKTTSDQHWRAKPFLKSRPLPRSWLESGKIAGSIEFDKNTGDKAGPLTIGLTLARPLAAIRHGVRRKNSLGHQRVVVVGDGDFLANAYLGNGGNPDLGLNIINWLSHNDRYIDIPARSAPDTRLSLSETGKILLASGFLVALPLILLVCGGVIWFRRRRQ